MEERKHVGICLMRKTIFATTKHADDTALGFGGIIERQCGTLWWLMQPRGF